MKKIIALFSVIATLALAACSVGSHSVSSGMPDEGYIWFVSTSEQPITVDIDGTTYQTQTVKEKEWQKRRDIKATTKGMITVTPGQHNVKVSERMAERIKIAVGSALTDLGDEAPEDYVVHGPNRITALPMEVPVCYQEVAHCLDKTVAKIENAVLSALENTPPELYADIVKNGIWLTGGGALLRGLDSRLESKINIPFHIAEDPLHSVAKGAGVALKNVDRFSFLMR